MQRVTRATAVAARPAVPTPGAPGFFTAGSPGGQPATVPGQEWYNGIQETLMYIIEQNGLTGAHGDDTLLYKAILAMVNGTDYKASVRVASTVAINLAAPGANIDGVAMNVDDAFLEKDHGTPALRGIYLWKGAAVPAVRRSDADNGAELNSGARIPVESGTVNADTAWAMTADGTITIGSTALTFIQTDTVIDATTAVKGKVQLATTAEARALTDALKALTPSTLADAFTGSNQSLAASGYQKLPGGLILQWMQVGDGSSMASDTAQQYSFPLTWPTACYGIVPGIVRGTVLAGGWSCYANIDSTSLFTFVWEQDNGSSPLLKSGFIIAIGK